MPRDFPDRLADRSPARLVQPDDRAAGGRSRERSAPRRARPAIDGGLVARNREGQAGSPRHAARARLPAGRDAARSQPGLAASQGDGLGRSSRYPLFLHQVERHPDHRRRPPLLRRETRLAAPRPDDQLPGRDRPQGRRSARLVTEHRGPRLLRHPSHATPRQGLPLPPRQRLRFGLHRLGEPVAAGPDRGSGVDRQG